jgi:hypothetical protein
LLAASCSQNREEIHDKLIERLNVQIKSGDYEQIYNELSDSAKRLTPKEEFLERIDKAVKMMRTADDSLSFQKDKNVHLSNDVYSDLYFEYRKIEYDNKKFDVEITVDLRFRDRIYDMCVSPSESSTVENQVCITNALRKI